jgi:hypothetical protein
MYVVKVYQFGPYLEASTPETKTSRRCIKTVEFPYGQWMEIAYWLDEYGFISPEEYEVQISFKKEWDD